MPEIAIIGAGCAGLGAATALLEARHDSTVTLIEAMGRIGGRAWTSSEYKDLPVDLGPQFIQDPDQAPYLNPWKYIAVGLGYEKDDLKQLDLETVYRVRTEDGWIDLDEFGNQGIGAANAELYAGYERACKVLNAPIMTGNAPDFCRGQQDLRLALGSSQHGAILESAEPWQYVARDQERQTTPKKAGDTIFVKDGLGALVGRYGDSLLEKYKGRLTFVPDTVVDKIDGMGPKVTIHAGAKDIGPFDFCIVTIPCGEIGRIEFRPNLPVGMSQAPDYVKLGSYKKVAFRPTKFPPKDKGEDKDEEKDDDKGKGKIDEDEKKEQEETSQGSGRIRKKHAYYIYQPPVVAYAEESHSNSNVEEPVGKIYRPDTDGVWQCFRLPTDPAILICVAAGDFARRLDTLPDKQVAGSVIELLEEAYPTGKFKPQNGEVVVTNWTKQDYIHGAYSYTRYDDRLGPMDPIPLAAREEMAKPHGHIHFAGEATWIPAYGTIHGAYNSGVRAAEEILARIKG